MVDRGAGPQGSQGDVPLMDSSVDRGPVDDPGPRAVHPVSQKNQVIP